MDPTHSIDFQQYPQALISEHKDSVMEDSDESLLDSMVCDSSSRLIPTGFTRPDNADGEYFMFVNAGGEAFNDADGGLTFLSDTFFDGGNVFRTDEQIVGAGDYPFIYQSARLGTFCYRFDNIPPGNYVIDLHFVEIINTNGPKGMRVFNVYIQEEKVLSELDIFAVAGANKPLQLTDSRVRVKDDEVILIRFESINGSPLVSGIGIRKATKVSVPQVTSDYIKCNYCAMETEIPSPQKVMWTKSTAKYENKIKELTMQCELKAKECYEAWTSLTATNEQLEATQMELDKVTFKSLSIDQTLEKQAENLRSISSRYELDKKKWAEEIISLQEKVKLMKSDYCQLSFEAHECVDSIPELNKMVFAVQELVKQCEDLKVKYNEEMTQRKKLFNEVQEAKGNIRVFCRCRPLNKVEISVGCSTVVDFDAAKDGCLGILTSGSTKKSFRFDRVYTPKDDQVDVFADASSMAVSVLDGYNVCIFAYGQTGTGKTFTMEGTENNRGVNYRTLELLFKISKERSETFAYDISVSVFEVYNEQIRDLLATGPTSKRLEIKQASEGSHHVPGVVEAKVDNISEVWNVLQAGSNARAVGSNNINEHSSRSHCMLCIMVKAKNLMSGECTKSKLWLVDLAGSERLARTDVQGERLKEAQNINRSLSALGDVISALAAKSSHIPYRNSKLTHLLQDSLGGDSKTLMFVQISPSDQDVSETLSSLNFATRVRGVELGPVKKQIDTGELQKIKAMLEKARTECRIKDESIRKVEENLQSMESKAKGKDNLLKNLHEKIKELEGQIELKTSMQNQIEKQISLLSEKLKGKEETCSTLQQKVKELEKRLKDQLQSETASYQQKVLELEKKLKDQLQGSESQSAILKEKVKELERKLKDQDQNSELSFYHQQVKELERKLKEQDQNSELSFYREQVKELEKKLEQQQQTSELTLLRQQVKELEDRNREQEQQWQQTNCFVEAAKATPDIGKGCKTSEKCPSEIDPHILRSSNSSNHQINQGSTLSKGNDFTQHLRSKGGFRSNEIENSYVMSSSLQKRKVTRKSDPPMIGKGVRPITKPGITTQPPPLSHKRASTSRDVQGIKERDSKKKIWNR
ncbi:PREDICTED: kinesin-like protein KIN-14R isoform X2 [Lupinus angustifolius]|uniref:kinesin-like protein KIN-14R isoform X2 n=1 Tax=Lupinus angustifolius TaxID=3871 RepID=UPI00092EC27A|nr:PREDICTED: kinesin-like protein KIN-14R isoform X2 [Lupinus angustifolius]